MKINHKIECKDGQVSVTSIAEFGTRQVLSNLVDVDDEILEHIKEYNSKTIHRGVYGGVTKDLNKILHECHYRDTHPAVIFLVKQLIEKVREL